MVDKLIVEINQPEIDKIKEGNFDEIENAALFNGNEYLSGNWYFEVHGEHCLFENVITVQTIEVSLGNKESAGNLDPYFFYQFLKTTSTLQHLSDYFKNPFSDMLSFFELLEKENLLVRIYGNEFRKV